MTAQVEPIIYGYLRQKAIGLDAVVFAINGTTDHVHMVVSIPLKIGVAKFVGQVKAVASTKFNKTQYGRHAKAGEQPARPARAVSWPGRSTWRGRKCIAPRSCNALGLIPVENMIPYDQM